MLGGYEARHGNSCAWWSLYCLALSQNGTVMPVKARPTLGRVSAFARGSQRIQHPQDLHGKGKISVEFCSAQPRSWSAGCEAASPPGGLPAVGLRRPESRPLPSRPRRGSLWPAVPVPPRLDGSWPVSSHRSSTSLTSTSGTDSKRLDSHIMGRQRMLSRHKEAPALPTPDPNQCESPPGQRVRPTGSLRSQQSCSGTAHI